MIDDAVDEINPLSASDFLMRLNNLHRFVRFPQNNFSENASLVFYSDEFTQINT